jgi:hypothetical protein
MIKMGEKISFYIDIEKFGNIKEQIKGEKIQ